MTKERRRREVNRLREGKGCGQGRRRREDCAVQDVGGSERRLVQAEDGIRPVQNPSSNLRKASVLRGPDTGTTYTVLAVNIKNKYLIF